MTVDRNIISNRIERTLRVPINIYEEFEDKVGEQYGEGKMNAVIVELMNRFLKQKSVMKISSNPSSLIVAQTS